MKQKSGPSEHKTLPFYEIKVDADQGIVEHLIAVHGILDLGGDISHPGSFAKTITERGQRIKVLDRHMTDSVLRVVGKSLSLQEVGRDELPPALLDTHPEATGGVKATTQFLLDTPEGLGVFNRIKAGAVDEFSYGYDAVKVDYTTVDTKDGESTEARNLREVKLYEYSPVVFAMQPTAQTLSAKDGEDAKDYACECLECGHKLTSEEHCRDIKCPECGGEMRRAERPGPGKVEVTENYVRVPADSGDHEGHRIRTIDISTEKGIKALYCGECEVIVTYLFDKDKWDVAKAKQWVADHNKSVVHALEYKWLAVLEEEEQEVEELPEIPLEEFLEADALEQQALEMRAKSLS